MRRDDALIPLVLTMHWAQSGFSTLHAKNVSVRVKIGYISNPGRLSFSAGAGEPSIASQPDDASVYFGPLSGSKT